MELECASCLYLGGDFDISKKEEEGRKEGSMPLFAKGLRVVSITMMKNVVQPCAQKTILAAPARLQALLLLQ